MLWYDCNKGKMLIKTAHGFWFNIELLEIWELWSEWVNQRQDQSVLFLTAHSLQRATGHINRVAMSGRGVSWGRRADGEAVLTSGEGVHQCGVCGWRGGGNCRLRFADLRVAFSELQPNGLRHVGVEADALLWTAASDAALRYSDG